MKGGGEGGVFGELRPIMRRGEELRSRVRYDSALIELTRVTELTERWEDFRRAV